MDSINEKLQELYSNNKSNMDAIFNSDKNIDGPHLIYCWDESYCAARKKILFIGKEQSGGLFRDYYGEKIGDNLLEASIENYKSIIKRNVAKPSTPIWRKMVDFNKTINGVIDSPNPCFLWSNVSKYCTLSLNEDEKFAPISWEDHCFTVTHMNILAQEIEICKPDIVIFYSGTKHYDDRICIQLDDEKNNFDKKLQFEPVTDDINSRELARLIHPILPHNSFRTWHPGSINRGKTDYNDFILATIGNS